MIILDIFMFLAYYYIIEMVCMINFAGSQFQQP